MIRTTTQLDAMASALESGMPYHTRPADRPFVAAVTDRNGRVVDYLRTPAGAAYAVRLLNAGLARVNAHAPIGLRVEAV